MERYMEVIMETLAQRIEALQERIGILEWENENLRKENADLRASVSGEEAPSFFCMNANKGS